MTVQNRRMVVFVFVAVVLVATVVAGTAVYISGEASDAADQAKRIAVENRTLFHKLDRQAVRIGQLQRTQKASCDNFETLRAAVNDFHGTIAKLLQAALRAREQTARDAATAAERRASLRAARVYKRLIANTHQVSATCAQKKLKQP